MIKAEERKLITLNLSNQSDESDLCPKNYQLMEIHSEDDLKIVTEYFKSQQYYRRMFFSIGHYNIHGIWYDMSSNKENKFITNKIGVEPEKKSKFFGQLSYDPTFKRIEMLSSPCYGKNIKILCEMKIHHPLILWINLFFLFIFIFVSIITFIWFSGKDSITSYLLNDFIKCLINLYTVTLLFLLLLIHRKSTQ